MVRDVLILMRENTFRGQLEGVGPENGDLEAQKKSRCSGPTPSNGPSNGFSRIKIIKSKRRTKKTDTLVIYVHEFLYSVFCILYSALFVVSFLA
jgi:hypothetical protein